MAMMPIRIMIVNPYALCSSLQYSSLLKNDDAKMNNTSLSNVLNSSDSKIQSQLIQTDEDPTAAVLEEA